MNSAGEFQGYCTQCHETRRIASGTFCPVCATALVDLHVVAHGESRAFSGVAASVPAAPNAPQWLPPRVDVPLTVPVVSAPAPRPRRSRSALVVTLLAVVLVIAGVTAVVLIDRSKSDRAGSPTVSPAATAPASPQVTVPESSGSTATTPLAIVPSATVPATQPASSVPPAAGGHDGVVIVGSTAFDYSSSVTIDGEGRTLYTVAELRNDNADTVEIGEITVTIRDAAGTVIGTRMDYPIDRVLTAGETTFLYEFTPSMMYRTDETNTFPEGWESFDLAFDVESPYQPSQWDELNLSVEDVVVSPNTFHTLTATGLVRNTTNLPVSSMAEVYVALHDSSGGLVNVAWTYVTPGDVDVLQPGETIPFEVPVWAGPQDYATVVVGAVSNQS